MQRRKLTREFKLEAVRLIKERGVSYAQASQDVSVHQSQVRDWAKKFADDPAHAFPGHGQMKPEQLEIARLKREVIKLKAERDIFGGDRADAADDTSRCDALVDPFDGCRNRLFPHHNPPNVGGVRPAAAP